MPTTPSGFRYPTSTAAPNVPQDIQNLALDMETVLAARSAWTSFTPTLTSTGTTPVMLAANRAGRYQMLDANRVIAEMRFKWTNLGGGEGVGTGDYRFSLPVPASSWYSSEFALGSASYVDVGTTIYSATAMLAIGTWAAVEIVTPARVGASLPVVPANGDSYSISVTYQAA